METVIQADKLSKWYGNVLGINEISLKTGVGVCGLLGPNGAGKSTFMKLATGQLKANTGNIKIFGEDIYNNHKLFRRIGFCPEFDSYFPECTGREWVRFSAESHGISKSNSSNATEKALDKVGLTKAGDKKVKEYSLGMRQRIKFAASIVHEPDLLFLDEPLRGIDPLWRIRIIDLIKDYDSKNRSVLVSSHVLPEVESMTSDIILIHQGKIFAHGDIHKIRTLLDSHPHQVSVKCEKMRKLAEIMVGKEYVLSVRIDEEKSAVVFETRHRDEFFTLLMATVAEEVIGEIYEITSPDDNLQAVFDYLIGRK